MTDIDDLLQALDDYAEARDELKQRAAEYTGYSPSWALAPWREVRDKAKQRITNALDKYIQERTPSACACREDRR